MPPGRLRTLDAIRGIAVMGILLMNVASFALPAGAYFNPRATGAPTTADLAVWAAAFVLVDGKMRALFSILFGASMLLVVDRAAATGRDPARTHLARMAVLALIGAAHGILLWPGDILLHYAIIGIAALPLTTLPPRRLLVLAALLIAAQATLCAAALADDLGARTAASATGAAVATVSRWQAFAASVGVGPAAAIARETALRLGPWPALALDNARTMARAVPFRLAFDGPETLAYMALGMAALRSRLLAGEWPRARALRLAAIALGGGLPLAAMLAWTVAAGGFDTLGTFAAATLGGVALRPAIAIGYVALAATWGAGPRLAAVGRAALSNYLLTSLLMCWLFDGWGVGLFARFGRAEAYLVVPVVWLAMLAWSRPWLDRFAYAPLEWCWRSLARRRLQPFRNPIETR